MFFIAHSTFSAHKAHIVKGLHNKRIKVDFVVLRNYLGLCNSMEYLLSYVKKRKGKIVKH